ncbi:DUF4097 family beta strand repeat-containing protein [Halomarina litorea]|uniref:DUF4097 family beta strand repeat-containing protein n=1 Tax=Halomarina litorea TaxID=2961595 RepID=UPI0020C48398|nr:DUF4097 family beta strand repeat-containing protein [Halomarina sp. BCD28]
MPSNERPARRAVLRAGAALSLTALAGCTTALGRAETDESTSTHTVPDGARLVVENRNGAVTVERGDGESLVLSTTKRTRAGRDHLDRVEVRTRTDGDRFVVERVAVDGADDGEVTVDVTLAVPPGVPVASVTTANGAVSLSGTAGDTDVRTENGAVTAVDVDGRLSLRTSNGRIEAAGVRGYRDLRTENGEIDASVASMAGDLAVETTNGRVSLALDRALDARIDASTTNGRVTVEGLALAEHEVRRERVTGRLGEGTHELRVRTTNGPVDLRTLEEEPT